jgi:hypothetical protein
LLILCEKPHINAAEASGFVRAFLINAQTNIATSVLLSGVMEKIDESYWAAMRSLEEATMLMK